MNAEEVKAKAQELAQAYLDKCAELDRAVTAINGAILELGDIVNMPPELDHPSMTLYRFDERDMEGVKHAKDLLEDFLAGYS